MKENQYFHNTVSYPRKSLSIYSVPILCPLSKTVFSSFTFVHISCYVNLISNGILKGKKVRKLDTVPFLKQDVVLFHILVVVSEVEPDRHL